MLFFGRKIFFIFSVIFFLFLFLMVGNGLDHSLQNKIFAYTETTYYIHQDNLGSVVAVTNDEGDIVNQNSYSSYGSLAMEQSNNETMNDEGRRITERSYTGQIQDASTSLSYYNARYYDSILSRFVSTDQVQGGNRFAYVSNNPILNSDPTGNMIFEDRDETQKYKKPYIIVNTKNVEYRSQAEILSGIKGCGPTSLAMILRMDPEVVARDMQAAGLFKPNLGTTINKIYQYVKILGSRPREYSGEEIEPDLIFSLMKKFDQPAIAAVHINYDLKKNGHIVVVLGRIEINDQDMVAIYDPYLFKTKPEEFGGFIEKNVLFVPFDVFERNFKSQGSDFMFVGEEDDFDSLK